MFLLDLLENKINQINSLMTKSIICLASNKTVQKIDETNLLNFYLSSVTMNNFKYEPTSKLKKRSGNI